MEPVGSNGVMVPSGGAHEAVTRVVCVKVGPHNLPRVIDATGRSPIDGARSVKLDKGAARIPQEAVS